MDSVVWHPYLVGYSSAGVAVCGAGLSGVEGKGRAAYRHHGQTKIGLVKRDVCVEAQRNGVERSAVKLRCTVRANSHMDGIIPKDYMFRISSSDRDKCVSHTRIKP